MLLVDVGVCIIQLMFCGWHLRQLMRSYFKDWPLLLVAMLSSDLMMIFHSFLSFSQEKLAWKSLGYPKWVYLDAPESTLPYLTLHQQEQLRFYLYHFDGWRCCETMISWQLHLSFFLRFRHIDLQVSELVLLSLSFLQLLSIFLFETPVTAFLPYI